jgi:hypothetical protein
MPKILFQTGGWMKMGTSLESWSDTFLVSQGAAGNASAGSKLLEAMHAQTCWGLKTVTNI